MFSKKSLISVILSYIDIEKVAEFEIQDGNCPGKKYKLECKCSEIFKIQSPQIGNVKQIQFYG